MGDQERILSYQAQGICVLRLIDTSTNKIIYDKKRERLRESQVAKREAEKARKEIEAQQKSARFKAFAEAFRNDSVNTRPSDFGIEEAPLRVQEAPVVTEPDADGHSLYLLRRMPIMQFG